VLPLVVPYLAWIGGAATTRAGAVGRAACFVLGFVVTFTVFGLTVTAAGRWLTDYRDVAGVIAGGVLVVVGLHVLGVLRLPALDRDVRLAAMPRVTSGAGAFVVGVAFAFGWSPCIGPILAAILALAAERGSTTDGAVLLGVYGLGMGVPFVLAAVFGDAFGRLARRMAPHGRVIERVAGVLVIVTGLTIMTGQFWKVGLWMLEAFPSLSRLG
jgi:cytochrome c-type biogenesis protein